MGGDTSRLFFIAGTFRKLRMRLNRYEVVKTSLNATGRVRLRRCGAARHDLHGGDISGPPEARVHDWLLDPGHEGNLNRVAQHIDVR